MSATQMVRTMNNLFPVAGACRGAVPSAARSSPSRPSDPADAKAPAPAAALPVCLRRLQALAGPQAGQLAAAERHPARRAPGKAAVTPGIGRRALRLPRPLPGGFRARGARPPRPPHARRQAMMRLTAAAAAALVLAGCASFSPDGGFGKVAELTKERTGQAGSAQRTASDADTARRPRRRTAEAAADRRQRRRAGAAEQPRPAGQLQRARHRRVRPGARRTPAQPVLQLRPPARGGGVVEIERAVMFDVLGLLTMPVAQQVRAAPLRAGAAAGGATRPSAWPPRPAGPTSSAVAAQELVRYFRQVKEAADASNELARRMVQAGNFNKLAQMREQAFYADATAQLARAQHQAVAERERLTRLLGLSGEQLELHAARAAAGPAEGAGRAEGRRADRDGQAPGRADGQARDRGAPPSRSG